MSTAVLTNDQQEVIEALPPPMETDEALYELIRPAGGDAPDEYSR